MYREECALITDLEFGTGDVRRVGQNLDGLLEHRPEGVVGAVTAERGRVRATHLLSCQVDYLRQTYIHILFGFSSGIM